jgi:hypothetical protein
VWEVIFLLAIDLLGHYDTLALPWVATIRKLSLRGWLTSEPVINFSEYPEEVDDHEAREGEEVESSESCCESFVISGESAEMGSPGPT